eukprot:CAMPEP_0172893332 /NCGR_PEP_ID=MMETSP1075-20121228/148235_1 /TAXON_ID=2916 /ORGANISM="Ceratium fusus, Strain PA161109" /LENGTH=55 /DNA_ID=CAMNT_0013748175 /DNA_START=234 /DNA_END=402 /DNA_ORIENTATION=-
MTPPEPVIAASFSNSVSSSEAGGASASKCSQGAAWKSDEASPPQQVPGAYAASYA